MKKVLISIPFLILMTSCSDGVRSTLGLTKESPDEFTVVSYPPLSVPPEFSLKKNSADQRAISQKTAIQEKSYTEGESSILGTISKQKPKTSIDEDIDREAAKAQDSGKNKGMIRKTLNKLNDEEGQELVIDPEAEKERISKNLQENRSINEGEVKSHKPSKSFIDRIFGK